MNTCIVIAVLLECCVIEITILQAETWIVEKITVASDESYRHPTKIQGKLQKHQAFEAELTANSGRVDNVEKVFS